MGLIRSPYDWIRKHDTNGCMFLRAKEEFSSNDNYKIVQYVNIKDHYWIFFEELGINNNEAAQLVLLFSLLENLNVDRINSFSFCSLLRISYYLSKENFSGIVQLLSKYVPKGSSVVFDYPDEYTHTEKAGERAKKQVKIAGAANQKMHSGYSYLEMEKLLADNSFLIYEHLMPDEMTEHFKSITRLIRNIK